jgi:hypothetical protein
VRRRTANLGRRLVLAQAFIDDLAQQIIFRPGEEFHFGDQLGPYPMHAVQHKRRSEAAAARRRHLKRHFVDRSPTRRLEPLSWTSSFRSSIMNLMRPSSAGVSRASQDGLDQDTERGKKSGFSGATGRAAAQYEHEISWPQAKLAEP